VKYDKEIPARTAILMGLALAGMSDQIGTTKFVAFLMGAVFALVYDLVAFAMKAHYATPFERPTPEDEYVPKPEDHGEGEG
jgi:hypothetical protein